MANEQMPSVYKRLYVDGQLKMRQKSQGKRCQSSYGFATNSYLKRYSLAAN